MTSLALRSGEWVGVRGPPRSPSKAPHPNPLPALAGRGSLLFLLLSSCTHLVWYGRSDDRRHIVSVIEEGNTQHVRLDTRDGPKVRGIGVDALVLTDDGHLAYPAEFADGWSVIHDGREGPRFDAIGELQLKDNHLAYTAEKAGKWLAVHDGNPTEPFDTILPGSLTLTGSHVAFAAQQGPSVFAILDGKRSTPMDAVGQLRLGTRSGFVGRRQGASYAVIDGIEQGPFESVAELHVGTPDVIVARTEGAWRVVVDGKPGEPFDRIAGLLTTSGTAYAGRRGKQEWIIDGTQQRGPFESIKSKLTRTASGRLVFVAQREADQFLFIGEHELGPFDEVEAPVVGGDHVAFIATARAPSTSLGENRVAVIVDGQTRSNWEWASSLVLSPDGTRFAHLARRDGRTLLVIDGDERTIDVVVAGTLTFSKDGRRFGCVTGDPKTRRLYLTRDDGKRTQVDMEEVVAALSRGNPDALLSSPDVTLLRRWVEAELEF